MASLWLQASGGAVGEPDVRVRFYGKREDDPLPAIALFTSDPGWSDAWQWDGLELNALYEVYPTVVGSEWESQAGPIEQAVAVDEPVQDVILSEWTDVVVFTTFAENVPPATPTGLTAVPQSPVSILTSWNASATATGYRLQFNEDVTFPAGTGTQIFQGTELEYLHTLLDPETTYFYRVQAFNTFGSSPWSAAVQATTPSLLELRTVIYTFHHADDRPWVGGKLIFRRMPSTASALSVRPSDFVITDRLDQNGQGSVMVTPNDFDSPASTYMVTMPSGEARRVFIPAGAEPFQLAEAIREPLMVGA